MVMPTHWLMGYFYPRPPRGGRPVRCCRPACSHHHFYPRPPRGGRQTAVSTAVKGLIFLSTPSARRATDEHAHGMTTGKISIHALREEGDTTHEEGTSDETHFYPRPPRGGRPVTETRLDELTRISIHALREEGDLQMMSGLLSNLAFLSTPSARRATSCICSYSPAGHYFYPRPPRGGRLHLLRPATRSTGHFYPRPPRGGRQKRQ